MLITSVVMLVLSLGMILLGAELFTNGIEWFGKRLQLAEGAVGSVLAAVGTALPETIIPVMAIVAGSGEKGSEIGVGAILGAPLMLSTLAFFVTGMAVIIFTAKRYRTLHMNVNTEVLSRDLRSFFIVYAAAIGAAFLPGRPLKILVGVFLLGAYVYYVVQTFRGGSDGNGNHDLNPLHFHRKAENPHLHIVTSQVLVALALIVAGAHVFVSNLETVAEALKVSSQILAIIITPIATELPEKFNSVIWIRQRKDTYALGNISGAMVFQSSIPPAIGIFFTPWALKESPSALAAALAALASTAFAWFELKTHKRLSPFSLLVGILFYVGYLVYIFGFNG